MPVDPNILLGLAAVPAAVSLGVLSFKRLFVSNPECHETLQLRFGKLVQRTKAPGLAPGTRLRPWDRFITVSRQWDERVFAGVETNDNQGTMVQVDLRITFRIVDGDRALFAVHDWEQALESATVHEAAAALAGKDRTVFLRSAPELAKDLTERVKKTMTTYGIEVNEIRILNVEFRPEVARQMFEAVAAKLEVAKAEIEEKGRTDAALLLARTEQQVAELEAKAKTESLKAIGRAYQELRSRPQVFEAYENLYRLAQLDPARVVSFEGFEEGELSRSALVESDLELDELPSGAGSNGQRLRNHSAP